MKALVAIEHAIINLYLVDAHYRPVVPGPGQTPHPRPLGNTGCNVTLSPLTAPPLAWEPVWLCRRVLTHTPSSSPSCREESAPERASMGRPDLPLDKQALHINCRRALWSREMSTTW